MQWKSGAQGLQEATPVYERFEESLEAITMRCIVHGGCAMHCRTLIATCTLGVIACLGNARAWGQMLVYAMTGTIRSVTTTELIATADGVTESFVVEPKSHPSFSFDKVLREDSTPIGDFHKSDTFAVIYYYGGEADRTAVAVKDLGQALSRGQRGRSLISTGTPVA